MSLPYGIYPFSVMHSLLITFVSMVGVVVVVVEREGLLVVIHCCSSFDDDVVVSDVPLVLSVDLKA